MNYIKKAFFLFLLSFTIYAQQATVRVMSYNLLNYPNSKDANFKKVISVINPDALVVVEMMSQDGVNQFLNNCLNTSYTSATAGPIEDYTGRSPNDCAFYYKSSVFTLIGSKAVSARTRIVSEFKLVHKITNDTLVVFGVHLKANEYNSSDNNASNMTKRADAARSLRTESASLNSNANYLVCGDFNIFSSTEAAFQNLVGNTSSKGYFVDMMNVTGDWSNNSAFNAVCTYSTSQLDTRLDMVLVSQAIMDKGGVEYKEFKIFGNDGAHFNKSVTNGANTWFLNDVSIGTALTGASDHLPVYVDLIFGAAPVSVETSNNLPLQFELKQNYPNPFNPSTTINYTIPVENLRPAYIQHITLKIFDVLGRTVATLVNEDKSPGNYSVKFDAGKLTSGIYFYSLQSGNYLTTKKMLYLK